MRKLNQKQVKWVNENVNQGSLLTLNEVLKEVVIKKELGHCEVERTMTWISSEDNYNCGLITHEEFLSGKNKVDKQNYIIPLNSSSWKRYFPELENIKSK